jgi:3-oxoacyl-[acyl-carrier-protein] synthase-3
VVQPAGESRGVIATFLQSDGGLGELLMMPGGGCREPISEKVVKERLAYVKMNGREVFKNAVRCMSDAGEEVLKRAGMTIDDVDWVFPHQANIRILQAIAARLNVPMEKVFVNLEHVGNISAASLPVALDEASRDGVIKRGDVILLVAFGAGFTWGATLLEW